MEIRVLGPTEIVGEDGPVRLGARQQRRLLAALALAHGETRSADALIDALWGESPPPSAPKLLQVYVSQLRKILPAPAHIETSGSGYRLALDGISFDADRFESLVDDGRSALVESNPTLAASLLGRGLDLWRGEAYADFAFDDFARVEADRLAALRSVASEDRFEALLAVGRHDAVLPELLALTTAEPLRERLHAQAMVALYRLGRQTDALELFDALRRRLLDIGLEPSPFLHELQRRILQQDKSLLALPHRVDEAPVLPAQPNKLVGRERELAELSKLLLRDDTRLIVLTGAGGSGKTRLALEVARRNASSFANGAALVDLAPLRDPDLVPDEIARTLGVRDENGEGLRKALATALRSRELLLLLDNAEHLRVAMPVLVELLGEAPRLTLLVTSRVVLHLSGEHVYPTEPLDDEAAAALFLERASEADARFELDGDGQDVVRRICRRLDCLPLAIELAASHVRLINPGELLARLESRLPLLTGGPRDLPARQRTLRATLDWTADLLDDQAIRDLMHLAVFAGCTLAAAEDVYGISGKRVSWLIDHNLVRRVATTGDSRYTMLETVREYALERLESIGGIEDARGLHAHYYVARAEQGADASGRQRALFFDSIAPDLENIRETLRWTLKREPATALRFAAALRDFWFYRDHLAEGCRWLEEVLAYPHEPCRDLAIVTADLARIVLALGDFEAARHRAERALEIAEALDLPDLVCDALNSEGIALDAAGRYHEALALFERALEIDHEHGIGKAHARTLYNLAHMMDEQDDQERARAYDLQGLELARERGVGTQRYLGNLIWRHLLLGEWDEALALSEQVEETTIPGRLGDVCGLPWIHVQRGEIGPARYALNSHQRLAGTGDYGSRLCLSVAKAVVLRAEGKPRDAFNAAMSAVRASASPRHDGFKAAFVEAVEAAFALDDLARARDLLTQWSRLDPRDQSLFLRAHERRFTARLGIQSGETAAVEDALREAIERFRRMSMPFYVAVASLELGEWFAERGRIADAAPLLAEARQIFEQLRATPWLERVSAWNDCLGERSSTGVGQ
jgi:predicted ATPase/DNA-binding SARP family transcriptional activator